MVAAVFPRKNPAAPNHPLFLLFFFFGKARIGRVQYKAVGHGSRLIGHLLSEVCHITY